MQEEAVKQIIELLQSGAGNLVQVMAEPQPLIAILDVAGLILSFTLIPYLLAKKVYPRLKQWILNSSLTDAHEDEAAFYAGVAVAITWLISSILLKVVTDAIIRAMYPEYWAIIEILQAISGR